MKFLVDNDRRADKTARLPDLVFEVADVGVVNLGLGMNQEFKIWRFGAQLFQRINMGV